ncbi:MFS transporter [Fodinicola acaciae]|uniref:MFS transporter n=1 Tax=Fodinicola acaciae TaxID=2681555 RepID=UPI0013D112BF|nr:MFS transporter [Fodinicola acaciae]
MTRSLRVRNYRLFVSGQIVSLTGSWMQTTAQDWLVLQLTHNSATAIGLVTALQFAPMMLLMLYGGLIADRFDKRKMLMVTQTVIGFLALGMGVLVVSGHAQVWHVFVFAAALGTAQAFDNPGRQAFVTELVGNDLLPNAVSLNSATFNTARILGPAVGGLVIAAVGVGPAFLLNSLTYIAVLASLFRMDPAKLHRTKRLSRAGGQLREAFGYVRSRPDLLMVFALMAVVGTLGMNFNFTIPLLARADFGVGAASFGLLSTCFAAGALCGALVGSRRRVRPPASALLAFAAIFGILEITVAAAPWFWIAGLVLVPTGGFLIACNTAANARVQLGAAPHLRGRVMALYMVLFFGGTPLGAIVIGAICQWWGVRAGFVVGGVSVLLAAGVLAAMRAYRHGTRVQWESGRLPRVRLVTDGSRSIAPGRSADDLETASRAEGPLEAVPGVKPAPAPGSHSRVIARSKQPEPDSVSAGQTKDS